MDTSVARIFRESIGSAAGIYDKLKRYQDRLNHEEKQELADYYGALGSSRREVPIPRCLR